MIQTIVRAKAIVQSEGQIAITDPALHVGEEVEVLILLPEHSPEPKLSLLDVLNSAGDHRLFKTAEEVDQYIREERDSWDF
ncbi:conserved protein of unknown function [Candidatus Promineifilum breve]|uniref:Uncharacterized protein n=1 Tax=Candidatus Promineifilum breve TaxID=1806508 RepID=A0A160T665_9CHLR|nr:hypothetical protein [Candidatus Promineifilum breve]CUS05009.2 conserved protein of unknown function [Candidatus Promineifilum breve]